MNTRDNLKVLRRFAGDGASEALDVYEAAKMVDDAFDAVVKRIMDLERTVEHAKRSICGGAVMRWSELTDALKDRLHEGDF